MLFTKNILIIGVTVGAIAIVGIGLGLGLSSTDDVNPDTTPVTTTPVTTTPVTTTPVTTTPDVTPTYEPEIQYIAYTAYKKPGKESFGPLYYHEIVDNKMQSMRAFSTPYYASMPYLTYNYDLKVIEIAGDGFGNTIGYHYHFDIETVEAIEIYPTQFRRKQGSSIVFTPEIGTVQLGGSQSGSQVIHMTPLSTMNDTISLPDLPVSISWPNTKSHNGKLFCVGGSYGTSGRKEIQVLDFSQSELEWQLFNPLSRGTGTGNIQFFNNFMYTFGMDSGDLEQYDINNQVSVAVYEHAFNYQNTLPASFVANGTLNVFGGLLRSAKYVETSDFGDVGNFVKSSSTAEYSNHHLQFCTWF